MKETMAMYEGMVADITKDNIKEREESQARLKELKSLIKAEVGMYEMIIARLQATNDQLLGEIGDLKKIIKVPRIHYKHIENLGLDDIKNQYEKINKKMEAQKRKEEEAAAAAAAAEEGEPGNETAKPVKGKKDRVGGASVRPVKLKHLQLDASSNPRARGF